MNSPIELIGFVTRSSNRVEALLELSSEAMTRPELQDSTGIPRATLSRILTDCWQADLIAKDGHQYHATPLGDYLADRLRLMDREIETIRQLRTIEQWLPWDAFDFDFVHLADAEVVLMDPADPHSPIEHILSVLEGARHVRALCDNAVHQAIVAEWRAITGGGQRLEALLTAAAVDVIAADPERRLQFGDILSAPDTEGYVYEGDIPCLVVLADDTVLLEAADEDGSIKGFVITDKERVSSWVDTTYEDYKQSADSINVDALTS